MKPPKAISPMRSALGRYALAVLLVIVAVFIRHLASGITSELPLVGMSFAMFFAAYFGGVGPGLLATGLSLIVGIYASKPYGTFAVAKVSDEVRLVTFTCLGILVSLLGERARRLQAQAAGHELALSESRYINLIYQSSDPILVLKNGLINVFNTQMTYLLGPLQTQGILGRSFLEFVVPEDRSLMEAWLTEARGGVTRSPAQIRFKSLGGSVFSAGVMLEVFESAGGRMVQVTLTTPQPAGLTTIAALDPKV